MTAVHEDTFADIVDVLIVAYENAESIASVVSDLHGRSEVASVAVVDHGTDGSAALAAQVGAVTSTDATNPGFGAGINRAAQVGHQLCLLLMNPDAELEPDALSEGLAVLAENPGVAAVQGLIRTPSTGKLERSGGKELGPIDLLGRALGAKALLRSGTVASLVRRVPAVKHQVDRGTVAPIEVEALAGTATLVRRDAFESIGGFDERFFLYGEDMDLCRRLRRAGWSLMYLPVPWADHENGSSSAGWWDRELRWWEGTMSFAARWWGDAAFGVARVASVVQFVKMSVRRPRGIATAWRAVIATPRHVRRDVFGPLDPLA